MSLPMYDVSIPAFLRGFRNLRAVLDKGVAHAESTGFNPAELLQARLYVDMYPLVGQVQRASDTAKGCAARLAGIEAPAFADNEASLHDLHARIDKTVAFLESVTPMQLEGSEERIIELKLRPEPVRFSGKAYLLEFALPNFYFHLTTAYDILRHRGVPLGKRDYLGLQ
ncbi:hypothetical protein BKK79_02635 [Cupriavidus sp. USMAA2-4]|uniref:DUF1993 domain-containing protein n=1 Tax=Cupriavidus malaysiensis TaxID=367825 RepID=A0ABM6F4Q0_9BURK|nr:MULTISPECIES: DUF1993 domain-containing protein [Cupriavidus]AOY90830.1 hypothetical protein BKK79_02635 [Cupriavidus sp. USMAA2-4]AOY99564.1 hypothetical protein BKK81_10030 [Cupriavidus sp. USMAHM13]AOZ06212.1 hypothetical protein BKK80_10475 [Cupriavidus malaysiensis]